MFAGGLGKLGTCNAVAGELDQRAEFKVRKCSGFFFPVLFLAISLSASSVLSCSASSQEIQDHLDPKKVNEHKASITPLTKRAEKGDVDAAKKLSKLYMLGLGVKLNTAESNKWLTRAAELGDVESQFQLGRLLTMGLVVPQDFGAAYKWFRRAAERGNAEAQSMLSNAYERGLGVAKDYEKAFDWAKKAAEQGHSTGQTQVAIAYQKGFGRPKDLRRAFMWMHVASKTGSALFASMIKKTISKDLSDDDIRKAKLAAETCISSKYKDCLF